MTDKIKTFKSIKLGKPDTHYFQARMTKGCENVKQSATSRIGELEIELYYCQQERDEAIKYFTFAYANGSFWPEAVDYMDTFYSKLEESND